MRRATYLDHLAHVRACTHAIACLSIKGVAYDLLLSFLQKKIVLGVAHTDPFFCASWAQKWQFLEVLEKIFRTTINVININ